MVTGLIAVAVIVIIIIIIATGKKNDQTAPAVTETPVEEVTPVTEGTPEVEVQADAAATTTAQ